MNALVWLAILTIVPAVALIGMVMWWRLEARRHEIQRYMLEDSRVILDSFDCQMPSESYISDAASCTPSDAENEQARSILEIPRSNSTIDVDMATLDTIVVEPVTILQPRAVAPPRSSITKESMASLK